MRLPRAGERWGKVGREDIPGGEDWVFKGAGMASGLSPNLAIEANIGFLGSIEGNISH